MKASICQPCNTLLGLGLAIASLALPAATLAQAAELAAESADEVTVVPLTAAEGTPSARGMFASVFAGAGTGERNVSVPSRRTTRRLSTGFFPALQLGLHGELALRRVLLGAVATYQTSVALQAASLAPTSDDAVAGAQLRVHSLALGLIPGYRFGATTESVAVRVFVGWSFRSLQTVVDLELPSYSLQGPSVRPELTIPIDSGSIVVRLAPELQLITGASERLTDLSDSSPPGFAFGGEASFEIRVYRGFCAALAYRDSYALLRTSWGSYLRDSERFVTIRLVLRRP